MSMFICPVCGEKLEIKEKSYVCKNRHSFDISSKGYVNLLLSNQMNARLPGDNKMMTDARADFLSKGYYSHLALTVSRAVSEFTAAGAVLDAGCGEGYYTQQIYESLSGRDIRLAAADISKYACARAARRFKGDPMCETAAASIFHLPVGNDSVDTLVTMFAPFCREEFFRVIKKGGFLIMAIPAENHLLSLKKAIYDNPYKNKTADYGINGFEFLESRAVSKVITIEDPDDIKNLFSMTPYYYKTGREGHERVCALKRLDTQAEFEVLIYRKD